MTPRERLIAYLAGKKVDRLPFLILWGPWAETVRRWKQQGMKNDTDWRDPFGFDPLCVDTGVNFGICPPFKWELLEDEEETIVCRDEHGVLQRARKDGTSMSEWLDYPVKDRNTWQEHMRRFSPDTPGRFPADWDKKARQLRESEVPVAVGVYPYGFFGGPRTMMGAEACLVACALEPELIEDINATLCNLWHRLWSRVFEETRVDMVLMWEDMASRQGSLISPAMFRRLLTPYYRKLMDLATAHGVTVRCVDSDGLMHELTPLFLEAGINVIFPYEVQAGNDLRRLLGKHPELRAFGHMDKRVMARDRAAMDGELERVKAVLTLGRYVPWPDHLIPPDVSWENYQYFVWRWKELTGKRD